MALIGLFGSIHLARRFARLVQVLLGDLARAVGVDDQQLVAAKFGRVLGAQIVAHVVGLVGVVHHHEQDRLLVERRKLLAVFAPAFDAGREVGLVAGAGNVRSGFLDAGGNALHRALDDVVNDGLLERIVDRPSR